MATIASDLLKRHIDTLVDDAAQWQTLIADDIRWELAYAPSVGHPARLSGREDVMRHVTWFRGVYRQNYVVFLRAAGGKIVFLREYFDPVRAAKAMNLPLAGLAS
jgi:hypothetical protein